MSRKISDTVGAHMWAALRDHAYAALGPTEAITALDCANWEGSSYGHAFRAAELAYDSGARAAQGARR